MDDVPTKYRVTRWRWFVLFYFCVSNCNQCLMWFSFSTVDKSTAQAYFGPGMSTRVLDTLLNWGPYMGVACFPLQSWIMQQPGGATCPGG